MVPTAAMKGARHRVGRIPSQKSKRLKKKILPVNRVYLMEVKIHVWVWVRNESH